MHIPNVFILKLIFEFLYILYTVRALSKLDPFSCKHEPGYSILLSNRGGSRLILSIEFTYFKGNTGEPSQNLLGVKNLTRLTLILKRNLHDFLQKFITWSFGIFQILLRLENSFFPSGKITQFSLELQLHLTYFEVNLLAFWKDSIFPLFECYYHSRSPSKVFSKKFEELRGTNNYASCTART